MFFFQILEKLKGHSQQWDCADLDATFASVKSVYRFLNPNQMYPLDTSRNLLQSCLVLCSILDLLQKTSFWANFYSCYDIILSYLVKNSIQRNMNRKGEKRVGTGWERSPSFTHHGRPRGSQSGREKRCDESFQAQTEEPLGTDEFSPDHFQMVKHEC